MVLLGHLIRLSRFKFTLFIMYQLMVETSSDALIDPEYNIREFLNGKVVRLAVFHYPPSVFVKKQPDGSFTYTGISIDTYNYFATSFNITFEYVKMKLEDVQKLGLARAEIKLLENDEVDMSALGIVASPAYIKQVDISLPVLIDPYRLFVPWPKEESRLLAPIRPFEPVVWICLGVSVVVMAPVLALISGIYDKYISKVKIPVITFSSVAFNIMFLLSHLTNHGFHLTLQSRAKTLLVGTWLLVTIVLANAYAGTLFSFLSVAKLEPIINSLGELAKSTEIQLITPTSTVWISLIMEAHSGSKEKIIADSLRKEPTNLIATMEDAEKKLMTGKYALAFWEIFGLPLIDSTYKKSDSKCRLTLAKEPISFFSPISHPLAKNGPFTKAFNEKVQMQLEAGLINKYIKNRMPRIDQCLIQNQEASAGQKSLKLVDMSSAFVIFGLGISLSVLVFLLEIIYKRFKKNYNKK